MQISAREKTLNYLILTVFAVVALTPLVQILSSAFARQDGPDGTSGGLANFSQAWSQGHFAVYMRNSLLVTAAVVALTAVLALLAGFAFASMDFPGRSVLFYLLLLGLMLPSEAFIIPLYFDLRAWGLTDTYASLVLPQTAQSVAFGTFWMRNYFQAYPASILDAARLDGAAERQLLWRVLVPSSAPALATMGLLVAMWTWNDFLLPLVMISDESRRTAPLGLAFFQGQHATQQSLLAAAAVIVALPIVALYLVLQRRFIAGIVAGSLKG
jgi:raffinose/stachyose/melibiose transport system permease protein